MTFSKRLATVPPYIFSILDDQIASVRDRGIPIIDLGISDPDMPPNTAVIHALSQSSWSKDAHHYPPYVGTSPLRQAVARWYRRRFDVNIDPDREVLITLGSKEVLVHAALAFLDPADVVLVPDPGYPAYSMPAHLFGARTVPLLLLPEQDFLPDLTQVTAHDAAAVRLFYVNYPNNPTGRVAPLQAYREWVRFCQKHGAVLLADLAYADIVFEGRAHSVFEVPGAKNLALETYTFSKGHNMQGWRIGTVVGGADLIHAVETIESNINAGVFLPIQAAATEALNSDDPGPLVAQYRKRRDLAYDLLSHHGFSLMKPEGAVYGWVKAPRNDGDQFARWALNHGVVVTPGSAFGPHSRGWFRVSLTHPEDHLRRGIELLAKTLCDLPRTVIPQG